MSFNSSCEIQVNPDIVGIGVRISLYILALPGPIIPFVLRSHELVESTEKAMGITGLALLLTTFLYAGEHQLDLFHAFCIFHLVGLVGLSIRPSKPEEESPSTQSKEKSIAKIALRILYYGSMLGFIIFMIYVFATAPHFGSLPECNADIKYVIFGIDVSATNPVFRGLFLVNFGLLIIALIISATGLLKGVSLEKQFGAYVRDLSMASLKKMGKDVSNAGEFGDDVPKDEGKKGFKMLGEILGRVYIITMLELMLHRNSTTSDGNNWGFGQILAMLTLLGPLIELASFFIEGRHDEDESPDVLISSNDVLRLFLQALARSIVCGFDLAICAAAGAAAAATGAHHNGDAVTGFILSSGAIAGVIASGVVGYSVFVMKAAQGITGSLIVFGATTFGTAFTVALAMSNRVLGDTPNAILIGSLVAGVPMFGGTAWNPPGSPNKSVLFNQGNVLKIMITTGYEIGFDALSAYTFARVARDCGYYICSGSTAAAAGAVYGIVVWVLRLPMTLLWIGFNMGEGGRKVALGRP